jgi:hypothetical protein
VDRILPRPTFQYNPREPAEVHGDTLMLARAKSFQEQLMAFYHTPVTQWQADMV